MIIRDQRLNLPLRLLKTWRRNNYLLEMMIRQRGGKDGLSVTKSKAPKMYLCTGRANAHLVSGNLNSSQEGGPAK